MVRWAHTTGSRLLRMLASHNASSDCARSPSYTEEGGKGGRGEGREGGRELQYSTEL